MGNLWDLIQKYIDNEPYPPSERRVAAKLGVSSNTMRFWRNPKKLPSRENLEAIANLIGVRYSVVLDAALRDTGYHEESRVIPMPVRPATTIEAHLRAAEDALAEFVKLDVPGESAESKRAELQAAVDSLKRELVSLRRVTEEPDSVAKM